MPNDAPQTTIQQLDAANDPQVMADWLRACACVHEQDGKPQTAQRLNACATLMEKLAIQHK